MAARYRIETLNDLFYALFKAGDGEEPVVRGRQKLVREETFRLLFPEELCGQYLDRSKSNLTWFFNDDRRNKAVKRALIALMEKDLRACVDSVHQKCRELLWPLGQHAAFEPAALRDVLCSVRLRGSLNAKWHIVPLDAASRDSHLDAFLEADASAALARMVLTLSVASDAPEELVARLWSADPQAAYDFLRRDETLEGQIRYSRMLDLEGRRAEAFEGFERVARKLNRPARTPDESRMYGRMGEMLFAGDGHFRDEQAARRYFALGCLEENPRSYYLLAAHTDGVEAREAMEKAAQLGCAPALRELGNAYYSGSVRMGVERDPARARHCFRRGMSGADEDAAYCAYMLGHLYEEENDRDSALSAYRIARENGSAEAADRLAALDWAFAVESAEKAEPAADGPTSYCLLNGLAGGCRAFLEGLRGRWETEACAPGATAAPEGVRLRGDSPAAALAELLPRLYPAGGGEYPRLAVALLSDDPRANLSDAVAALGEMRAHASLLREDAPRMADSLDVYVLAEHDGASAMLDAALAGLSGLCFRVRLCDPAWDAADELFSRAPLFLPCLQSPEDGRVRMNVIGTGSAAMAVLRRAVSLPMPEEADLSVCVFGEDSDSMQERFAELCPGVETAPPAVRRLRPTFASIGYEGGLSASLRRLRRSQGGGVAGENAVSTEEERLGRGNYYVVATDDDDRNIRLALMLRRELLKLTPTFDNLPFIAVYVRDGALGWLAGSMDAGPNAARSRRYGQYDLFPFGMLSMYGCDRLDNDLIESRARRAHLLYAGRTADADARRAAMASYYRRQYERDSSRATAIALIYRLYQAGIALGNWRLYGLAAEEERLGAAYTAYLQDPAHLADAVRREHEHWNCVMLSLGWESATPLQTAAYVQRGNPGHQLYLGRMHPYICPWQALQDGELVREVRRAVQERFPERDVRDPREADEAAVRCTELLMRVEDPLQT